MVALKILIGITTFKRPIMLRNTLAAIEALEVGPGQLVEVVVADNDAVVAEGVGLAVRVASQGYRFPIVGIAVPGQGFTYPRNALVEFAFNRRHAHFLFLVDDDQIPNQACLRELLAAQLATNAGVVGAAIYPIFDGPPPKWAIPSGVYSRDETTNGLVPILSGDGGILMSRLVLGLLPLPWYDHSLAMTGGADTELFIRMENAGVRFARAAKARIGERYPASRLTLRWALQRAYRSGNCQVLIDRKRKSNIFLLSYHLPRIAAGLVVGHIGAVLYLVSPALGVRMGCKAARAWGKVAALLDNPYYEYGSHHGR